MVRGTAFLLMVLLGGLNGFCQGWSPRLAADYLDARQQAWNAWSTAKAPGGACFSCHTGMTYLIARPSLRRALGAGAHADGKSRPEWPTGPRRHP
jgi:hypothetical protein